MTEHRPDIGEPAPYWRTHSIPVITVIFASALPTMLPLIASSPVLPPMGLLIFLSWQLLRTEMWPVWIGLPLGLADDLFSGAPIGTAIFLWTITSILIHYLSQKILWRTFWHDWLIAAICIALIQTLSAKFSHPHAEWGRMAMIVAPQIIASILLFPIFMRLVGSFDRFRLKRR
ncbi:MAG TPA: rod shape-determining protein MreD [Sphingopyxis sp.]|nr:rod shape-determining protein MreD [Sphingopyxis sp.]